MYLLCFHELSEYKEMLLKAELFNLKTSLRKVLFIIHVYIFSLNNPSNIEKESYANKYIACAK